MKKKLTHLTRALPIVMSIDIILHYIHLIWMSIYQ